MTKHCRKWRRIIQDRPYKKTGRNRACKGPRLDKMSSKTKRVCQVCGKPFYGAVSSHYRQTCAKIKKMDAVIRTRTCQDCGNDFLGGPRARRCPSCAHIAMQETSRRCKKQGTKRPLGSIDRCEWCGADYIVGSGRQKYCSDQCQHEAVLKWQREHKRGYNKASGQDIKKQETRKRQQKICVYCLRPFTSSTSTNLCSDYCRDKQKSCSNVLQISREGLIETMTDTYLSVTDIGMRRRVTNERVTGRHHGLLIGAAEQKE